MELQTLPDVGFQTQPTVRASRGSGGTQQRPFGTANNPFDLTLGRGNSATLEEVRNNGMAGTPAEKPTAIDNLFGDGGLSLGAIIGIATGGLCCLVLLAVIVVFCFLSKREGV